MLVRYVDLCNHQQPESALKSKTPIQAMKNWYAWRPELFDNVPTISRDATPRHFVGRTITAKSAVPENP